LLILHFFELNYFTNSIFLSLFFFKPPLLLFILLQSFFFNLTLELKSLLVLFPCSFSQLFIRVKDRYSFLLNFFKGIVFLHCTGTLRIDNSNWSLVVLRGFRSKQVFHRGFINVGQSYWLKLFFTCSISQLVARLETLMSPHFDWLLVLLVLTLNWLIYLSLVYWGEAELHLSRLLNSITTDPVLLKLFVIWIRSSQPAWEVSSILP
jgi:hypothetical protein